MQLNPNWFQSQRFGNISYAQHGDDLMLLNIFDMLKIEKGSYLDLGANHPYIISNTALLYEKGWRGVNVEANINCMLDFCEHRSEDKNIFVGVAAKGGTLPFYMRDQKSGLNTFDLKETAWWGDMENRSGILLPVTTINLIVQVYCKDIWPDLLLLDIEGLDYEVLESAKFQDDNSPKIIVVETRTQEHKSKPMKDLLNSKGYFCYCRMGENLFFIRNDFKDLVY